MSYLSVGTNKLSCELFQDVKNGASGKPYGGLWATEYDDSYPNFNIWVEFICSKGYLLYYKYPNNPYCLDGVVFELESNANIYKLDSKEKLDYLKINYPSIDNWIDYPKLAEEYDGIYVDLGFVYSIDKVNKEKFKEYDINSLILFGLKPIKKYKEAKIEITPVYNRYGFTEFEYEILINDIEKVILPEKEESRKLIKEIRNYIISNNLEYNRESSNLILSIYEKEIANILKQIEQPQKENLLIRKAFLGI